MITFVVPSPNKGDTWEEASIGDQRCKFYLRKKGSVLGNVFVCEKILSVGCKNCSIPPLRDSGKYTSWVWKGWLLLFEGARWDG